jgi:hypothetical protein
VKLKYLVYLASGILAFSFPVSMAALILAGFVLLVLANLGFFIVGSLTAAVVFGVVQKIVGEEVRA